MEKFNNYVSNLEVLQYAGQQDLDNEFILVQFEFGWMILKDKLEEELIHYYGDMLSEM